MVGRYHRGDPVTNCPKCGRHMEVGSRVKVMLFWEMDDRFRTKSVSGLVCRDCAEAVSDRSALEVPDEVWPYL